jgi:gamma-glutamyltranspeptidase/glutathione hydrolase
MRPGSPQKVHYLAEAMRRAYADRARYLGDPDFVEMPLSRLLSKEYAATKRRSIRPHRASKSRPDSFEWPAESTETTHLSVVDAERMAVSLTTTLEQSYGARIVCEGAGFLLNNEMGDFNAAPGLTTEKGLIGTAANLAGPGRRPLSSMTPTIVLRDGEFFLALGSPGGRTIINTVLQVLVNVVDHGLSLQAAVDAPRFHHQWLPDRLLFEEGGLTEKSQKQLEEMGHEIALRRELQGSVMAVRAVSEREIEAGVDQRLPDGAAAGY